MGCDFYIEKCLFIYYKDGSSDYITLSIDRGYFYLPSLNKDDPDYEKKYNELVKLQLKPRMEPLIIYHYDAFITNFVENKYRPIVEKNLEKNKYWVDIEKMVIEETRYERD